MRQKNKSDNNEPSFFKKHKQLFKILLTILPWIFVAVQFFIGSTWLDVKYFFVTQDFEAILITTQDFIIPDTLRVGGDYNVSYKIYNNSGRPLKPMIIQIKSKYSPEFGVYNMYNTETEVIQPYDVGQNSFGFSYAPSNSGKDTIYIVFKSRLDSTGIKTQREVFNVQ
jgi:hypothetical protein